ncbi:hypothetical protein HDU91_003122, partial [Kappamyces sp. JEL0680]
MELGTEPPVESAALLENNEKNTENIPVSPFDKLKNFLPKEQTSGPVLSNDEPSDSNRENDGWNSHGSPIPSIAAQDQGAQNSLLEEEEEEEETMEQGLAVPPKLQSTSSDSLFFIDTVPDDKAGKSAATRRAKANQPVPAIVPKEIPPTDSFPNRVVYDSTPEALASLPQDARLQILNLPQGFDNKEVLAAIFSPYGDIFEISFVSKPRVVHGHIQFATPQILEAAISAEDRREMPGGYKL